MNFKLFLLFVILSNLFLAIPAWAENRKNDPVATELAKTKGALTFVYEEKIHELEEIGKKVAETVLSCLEYNQKYLQKKELVGFYSDMVFDIEQNSEIELIERTRHIRDQLFNAVDEGIQIIDLALKKNREQKVHLEKRRELEEYLLSIMTQIEVVTSKLNQRIGAKGAKEAPLDHPSLPRLQEMGHATSISGIPEANECINTGQGKTPH